MRISLLTLGCKVNQAEMSGIESALRTHGHEIVGLGDSPEVCVVNTCTVTAKSDYQSRQLIRRAGRAGARVIVTGCYSELNREKVAGMEGVCTVIGNPNKNYIINILNGNSECNTLATKTGRTRCFLKVQDGCDNSCSYCIVPRARGRSRSLPALEVIEAVNKAVDSGYKEIVLTGIHLGQYRSDGQNLPHLVGNILNKTKVQRLRLSSIEVTEIDGMLLDLFDDPRLMRHLHIPLQSGDDDVLRLMNRGYDRVFFTDAIMRIAERLPGIAIGTDVIAGFPAESLEAFDRTAELVEDLPFSYLHVFQYSRRPGTEAAELPDIVGADSRKRRSAALRAISSSKKLTYMKKQVGRILDVLIEEICTDRLSHSGTSTNYLKVRVSDSRLERGSIVPVKIMGVSDRELVGEPVNTR